MFLHRLFPVCSLVVALLVVGCGAADRTDLGNNGGNDAGPADAGGETIDAGPLAHESYVPPDQHPSAAARLIVMGDSISAGVGASRTSLSYFNLLTQNDNAWSTEGSTSLSTLFGTSVPVVNVAVSGATTASALSQRDTLTQQLPGPVSGHSIVVITIGGNDMKNLIFSSSQSAVDSTVNNAVSNVRSLMTYLKDSTHFPDGVSIYLAAVYDPSDSSGTLPASCFGQSVTNVRLVTGVESLKARFVLLGQEMGFAVVDALGHFHGHGVEAAKMSDPHYNESNPVTWFYNDCIHPNDAGHNELRRLFFEAIDKGHYTATDI